jgi:hypothetical protein
MPERVNAIVKQLKNRKLLSDVENGEDKDSYKVQWHEAQLWAYWKPYLSRSPMTNSLCVTRFSLSR